MPLVYQTYPLKSDSPHTVCLHLPTLAATQAVANLLATWLQAGDTLALQGEMGSGKTTWVAALVQALQLPHTAGSPTYTLVHEYVPSRREANNTLAVWHSDWYRLEPAGAQALWHEGLAWQDETEGVLVVEWPQRAQLPLQAWTLCLALAPLPALGDEARSLTLTQPLQPRPWPEWPVSCRVVNEETP